MAVYHAVSDTRVVHVSRGCIFEATAGDLLPGRTECLSSGVVFGHLGAGGRAGGEGSRIYCVRRTGVAGLRSRT
jgi:hypothetical protein